MFSFNRQPSRQSTNTTVNSVATSAQNNIRHNKGVVSSAAQSVIQNLPMSARHNLD